MAGHRRRRARTTGGIQQLMSRHGSLLWRADGFAACSSRGDRRTPVRRSSPLAGSPAAACPAGCGKGGDQRSTSSLAAVTSTSRLASASPTRAAFERLGLRGGLSHVLAGQASGAVLTCHESPVASSASRCGLDVRAHCGRLAGRGRPRGAGIAPRSGQAPVRCSHRRRADVRLRMKRVAFAAGGPLPVGAPPFVQSFAPAECPPVSLPLVRAFAQGVGRRRHRLPGEDVTGRQYCRKGRYSGPSPWGGRVSSSA